MYYIKKYIGEHYDRCYWEPGRHYYGMNRRDDMIGCWIIKCECEDSKKANTICDILNEHWQAREGI